MATGTAAPAGEATPDEERGAAAGSQASTPGEPMSLKEKVYRLTDMPSSSSNAMYLAVFILLCIVASTACFCLETLPALEKYEKVWYYSELFFITVFTTEYVVRFWATPLPKTQFVTEPFNIIDLLAILPFYLELVMQGSTFDLRVLRAIRLVRLFRVFKVGKYSTNTQLIALAMSRSKEALLLLVFFLMVAMILFATLMFSIEQGSWDRAKGCYARPGDVVCSPFESIPHGFYWAITTMTTVGYGDVLPTTNLGQLVCAVCMVCGILVIALPITMIGNSFIEAYSEIKEETKLQTAHQEIQDERAVHRDLLAVFAEMSEIKDECDHLLPKMKQLLAAAMDGHPETKSPHLSLSPSYDLLQKAAIRSIDDLSALLLTSLPPAASETPGA